MPISFLVVHPKFLGTTFSVKDVILGICGLPPNDVNEAVSTPFSFPGVPSSAAPESSVGGSLLSVFVSLSARCSERLWGIKELL